MKVYTRLIEGHRVLNYIYAANSDMVFHFHLLSEVGEPWQAQAREMAQRLADATNSAITQIELDAAPWYVDALTKRSST